jgi:hypothetical protein
VLERPCVSAGGVPVVAGGPGGAGVESWPDHVSC